MNAIRGLVWLEMRKTLWLFAGVGILLALLAPIVANVPDADRGEEEQAGGPSSSNFSFQWNVTRGGQGSLPGSSGAPPGMLPPFPNPPSSQTAPGASAGESAPMFVRGRQLAVLFVAGLAISIALIGFFFAHYRESDSGEIALFYQAPLPAELQLGVRFLFMAIALGAIWGAVLLLYWVIQQSQGGEFFGPIASGFGAVYGLDWMNISLLAMLAFAFPSAAFILLFCQVQNAYALLGRRRLAGLVVLIAWIQFGLLTARWIWVAGSGDPDGFVYAYTADGIDATAGTVANAALLTLPPELIQIGVVATLVMLAAAGLIWREVEWG